jgi:lanosterol synthase
MILSQYVIVRHIVGRPIDAAARQQILQHYAKTRTSDGGWALHPEGPTQIFTTTLAYVALRLAGVGAEHELVAPARGWLQRQPGGVLGIPTWGKFWLALLDLYGYEGVSTLPPELFVLPAWLKVHPSRWYCHTRYIYLGMAYLSGRRFTANLGELGESLRRELYAAPYDTIDFAAHREHVSPTDLYVKPATALAAARRVIAPLEPLYPRGLRARALGHCFESILYEQRASRYQALSPVNGLLNCLAIFARDPKHPELGPSLDGLEAWKWSDEPGGTRYAGARSQTWDTAFACRALLAAGDDGTHARDSLRRAYEFLKSAQLAEDLPSRLPSTPLPSTSLRAGRPGKPAPTNTETEREHRAGIRGGWCFSDGTHRWPVSDCTAESLTTMLEMEAVPGLIPAADRLPEDRVRDAVTFLLARQNPDGGFSTYEAMRGAVWLDRLNPSEMFRDCMTERSYIECTASAVEALAKARVAYPDLMGGVVAAALSRAIAFLRRSQRPDGSFPGAWGINFTYAIFHVTKALVAAGVDGSDPALVRAAAWLREKQRADGGWGEHFSSCLTGTYVEHPRSQVVMTSWALLALTETAPPSEATAKGMRWLASKQQPDGSWPDEAVNGVFFGTAMLDYRLYRVYFPVWALARQPTAR